MPVRTSPSALKGAPGHQASGERGFGRGAAGGGTYGGSGWFSAEVGGLWDSLLGEGRNWWNFASSDSHAHWSVGGGDFWPGEYQKNYTYIHTDLPWIPCRRYSTAYVRETPGT